MQQSILIETLQVEINIVEKILFLAEICLADLENGFELSHQFVERSADVVGTVVCAVGDSAHSKRLTSGLGLLGIF